MTKQLLSVTEYDGVPISVIGNLRSPGTSTLNYQIPAGIMEDSTCEHSFIDLSNSAQCKKLFDSVIKRCYENNTWKIEVWAITPKSNNESSARKKRGLLSYLSFRRRKTRGPAKHTRATRSLPWMRFVVVNVTSHTTKSNRGNGQCWAVEILPEGLSALWCNRHPVSVLWCNRHPVLYSLSIYAFISVLFILIPSTLFEESILYLYSIDMLVCIITNFHYYLLITICHGR